MNAECFLSIMLFKGQKSRKNTVMILSYVETAQVLSTTDNCISVPKNVILVTMEIKFNTSACDLNSVQ